MGCNVCLDGADGDVANEFFHVTHVKARKEHRCVECRQLIPVGAEYARESGKGDGGIFTEKTCATCFEIRATFTCGRGYFFGTLWEDMTEQAFPWLTTASNCFTELSPAAKGVVMDRWRTWKGLEAAR